MKNEPENWPGSSLIPLTNDLLHWSLYLTVWASVVEVLVAYLASPEYTAVIACVPRVSVLMVHVAVFFLVPNASAAQPMISVPPFLKATVPVGDVPLTLAVKATLLPYLLGLLLDLRLVVVGNFTD